MRLRRWGPRSARLLGPWNRSFSCRYGLDIVVVVGVKQNAFFYQLCRSYVTVLMMEHPSTVISSWPSSVSEWSSSSLSVVRQILLVVCSKNESEDLVRSRVWFWVFIKARVVR